MGKRTRVLIWCVVVIVTLSIAVYGVIGYQKNYKANLSGLIPPSITYKSVTMSCSLNSDFYVRLYGFEKNLYYGELPQLTSAIKIGLFDKGVIYLYPYTQDTVIIDYQPLKGWNSQFELVGSSFNSYLKILYQLTGNEVFNETLDLPAVQR